MKTYFRTSFFDMGGQERQETDPNLLEDDRAGAGHPEQQRVDWTMEQTLAEHVRGVAEKIGRYGCDESKVPPEVHPMESAAEEAILEADYNMNDRTPLNPRRDAPYWNDQEYPKTFYGFHAERWRAFMKNRRWAHYLGIGGRRHLVMVVDVGASSGQLQAALLEGVLALQSVMPMQPGTSLITGVEN